MRPLALLLALTACTGGKDDTAPTDTDTDTDSGDELPGELLVGTVPRNTSPSTADVPALAAANNQFAWDLTRHLLAASPDDDLALSPWSIEVAFAQAHAGADDTARSALDGLFHWSLEERALHEAFDATWLAVDGHTAAAADPPVTVQTTSQAFFDDRITLEPAWLDLVGEFYGTGGALLDLDGDPEGSADAINAWISARTEGVIPQLVTPGLVASSAVLLVNCVYLAASWDVPFSEGATRDETFTLRDGTTVQVPTMHGEEVVITGHQGDGWVLFELPTTDPGLTMAVLLPDAGTFDAVVGALDWATIQAALDAQDQTGILLALPKFSIDSRPDMNAAIRGLGGEAVFGAYPGIAPDLVLVDVQHRAVVEVNEKGVVAAAATSLSFDDSAWSPPLQVEVDRPFLWWLREGDTGTVLFSGALLDPR